jgi:hypothetical protein
MPLPLLAEALAALFAAAASGASSSSSDRLEALSLDQNDELWDWVITIFDDQFFGVPTDPAIGYVDVNFQARTVTAGTLSLSQRFSDERFLPGPKEFEWRDQVLRIWVREPLRGKDVYDFFDQDYVVNILEDLRTSWARDPAGRPRDGARVEFEAYWDLERQESFNRCVGPREWLKAAGSAKYTVGWDDVIACGVLIFEPIEEMDLVCGTLQDKQDTLRDWVREYLMLGQRKDKNRVKVDYVESEASEARGLVGLPALGFRIEVLPANQDDQNDVRELIEAAGDNAEDVLDDGARISFVLWLGKGS